MDTTYIFGHKQPDTDSVCSAIALSYLKNELGIKTAPRVLGDLNSETGFVLNYFNIKTPMYLNDVKLQIKDLNYGKNIFCFNRDSLYNATLFMEEHHLSSIPVVDEHRKLTGLLSMKDITSRLVSFGSDSLNSSFDNILNTIRGEAILKFDDEIKGEMIVPSYSSTTFINDVYLNRDSVVILGDRHSIIEYALESSARMIIITGGSKIKEEHLEIARRNQVNIIHTQLRTFNVVKVMDLCNYVETLQYQGDIGELVTFNERDYVKNFIDISSRLKYRVFPVINNDKECLGLIQLGDTANRNKKKVILVDHNEMDQSVDGLEEAEIIEIVDHHKIGSVGTLLPINFRNMPVGCTSTIVYMLYRESNVAIPKHIAGIMLSSILSDTLMFKSPTTTNIDKEVAMALAGIADINIEEHSHLMYSHSSSLKNRSASDILFSDLKIFHTNDLKVGVGQVTVSDIADLEEMKTELFIRIEDAVSRDYNLIALFAVDIFRNGSYIYFSENSKHIWEAVFDVRDLQQGTFLSDIISRKKQIIPKLVSILEVK